jgi:hypothetical protein
MFVALPRKVDTMLPRFDAGHKHDKQTNEFAARGIVFVRLDAVIVGSNPT